MTRTTGAVPAVAAYLSSAIPLRLASSGSSVVLPVLAVQRQDDLALGGVLVATSLAPSVLIAPLAGAALDRSRRPRRLFVGAGFLTALALALAAFLGDVPLPVIVVLLAASGCVAPFLFGGLSSVVADVIPGERRAFAQDALVYNVAAVAGPGVAALAIALTDARTAMLLIAAIAAAGSAVVAALPIAARVRGSASSGVLGDIAEGARYLFTHRPLAVVTASGTLNQLGAGALPIAAVVLSVERAGGADGGAVLVTAFAVGSLAGSILTTFASSSRLPPVLVMAGGFLLTGLMTFAAAPDWGLAAAVGAIAVSGVFSAPATAAMLLLRKQHSPASVRSQVFSVGAGLRVTAGATGAAVAGFVAGIPAAALFAVIGALWVASALLLVGFPRSAAPFEDDAILAT